jgi:hypothetical protein
MKKTNIFQEVVTSFSPIMEKLIINICKDLDKEDQISILLNKYLYTNKIKTLKNLQSKKKKTKRRKTSYSMFLAHNNIRKENKILTLKEYNTIKGQYWKKISIEEKNKYQKMAETWNEKNLDSLKSSTKSSPKLSPKLSPILSSNEIILKKTNINENESIIDCFFDDMNNDEIIEI